MADVCGDCTGWEELGQHRGTIVSLDWSPDGSSLYCGSYGGEIRNWQSGEYKVIQERPLAGGGAEPKRLTGLTWSQSEKALFVSFAGGLAIYKNATGSPLMIPEIDSVMRLRCSADGSYLASREFRFNKEKNQDELRLRIRSTNTMAEIPLLDSDLFARNDNGHYDFSWNPNGHLLAILSGEEIHFASTARDRLLSDTWWVGSYANAITWISDDQLAVAFGDANIRVYSWGENVRSQLDSPSELKVKAVLERHTSAIHAIASGCNREILVSIDLYGCLHVWSNKGQHLGQAIAPAEEFGSSTTLAVHPQLPIVVISRSNVLYQWTLDTSGTPIEASSPDSDAGDLLTGLLKRAVLAPVHRLTSDDALDRWSVDLHCETANDAIARTLGLRKIAALVSELALKAKEATLALWEQPDHDETIALENLDLSGSNLQDGGPETLRQGLRELLLRGLVTDNDRKRTLTLCAYTALAYLERVTFTELENSAVYLAALDRLRDSDLRLKLKKCRVVGAKARTAEDVAANLETVYVTVNDALSKLPAVNAGEKAPSDQTRGTAVMNALNEMKDIVVVAAVQELHAVRRCLDDLGLPREEHFQDGRVVETFRIPNTRRGEIVVGLMFSVQKGKSETKSLLESIRNHSSAQHVLMVGMMAGIKGRSKLLDVIAPLTVYDVTAIGTTDGKLVVEPEAGTMDTMLHNSTASIDPIKFRDPQIRLISHKKTVTFSAKIDDLTHDLAASALNIDRENVVGLEMEGSALIEMQTRNFGPPYIRYLMIKGVADYAGERPDKAEVQSLSNIPGIKDYLSDPDPTKATALKEALQREATCRAFLVALELLKKLPLNSG